MLEPERCDQRLIESVATPAQLPVFSDENWTVWLRLSERRQPARRFWIPDSNHVPTCWVLTRFHCGSRLFLLSGASSTLPETVAWSALPVSGLTML